MSAAPVRSPTLRPHRMKKDESFLGKLGGTLARKKKAKEGEFARAEGRQESASDRRDLQRLPRPVPSHRGKPAGQPAGRNPFCSPAPATEEGAAAGQRACCLPRGGGARGPRPPRLDRAGGRWVGVPCALQGPRRRGWVLGGAWPRGSCREVPAPGRCRRRTPVRGGHSSGAPRAAAGLAAGTAGSRLPFSYICPLVGREPPYPL